MFVWYSMIYVKYHTIFAPDESGTSHFLLKTTKIYTFIPNWLCILICPVCLLDLIVRSRSFSERISLWGNPFYTLWPQCEPDPGSLRALLYPLRLAGLICSLMTSVDSCWRWSWMRWNRHSPPIKNVPFLPRRPFMIHSNSPGTLLWVLKRSQYAGCQIDGLWGGE